MGYTELEHAFGLLMGFLNTLDVATGIDKISNADELQMWLADHELGNQATAIDADIPYALDLRESIRDLVISRGSNPVDPAAARIIRDIWRKGGVALSIDPTGLPQLIPSSYGIDAGLGMIAASLFLATSSSAWGRLKVCGNAKCQRVFYDRSRNRSGKWCSMASCGNLMKVRAYRRRKRLTENPVGDSLGE